MADRSYLNPMDDFDEEDENKPYSSISDRPALPVESGTPVGDAPANPAIKDFLLKARTSTPNSTTGSMSLDQDPMMQEYFKDKTEMGNDRLAKVGADYMSNLGQAASQIALGTNTPQQNKVFQSIDTQNQDLIDSKNKEMDR